MSFLKLLASLFTPARERPRRYVLPLSVQCHRCGEVIHGEINLANDLSADYGEDGGGATTYVCRKVLVGAGRCFQQIELELTFDEGRKILQQHVTGGKLLETGATQTSR
ncbi:MAG: hypothetical protein IT317_22960 [Anaerolineales bacterium]|nr:hypothetical protein [Anaerolineales bacterium]